LDNNTDPSLFLTDSDEEDVKWGEEMEAMEDPPSFNHQNE
jgi:hypothetical protein